MGLEYEDSISSGDDKGDREGDKRPKHSGGIHASYEAHIE